MNSNFHNFFKITTLLSLALTLSIASANESDCAAIKKAISSQSIKQDEKKNIFNELNLLIKNNSSCAKNLLGRIYYEGNIVTKDVDKAHGIFFDLAEKSYPPAMYNLALLSIHERKAKPQDNLKFLHGLMIKYSGDDDWGFISANSRELGFDYLDSLNNTEIIQPTELDVLRKLHTDMASKSANQLADVVRNRSIETRNRSDAIAEVLLIAGAAYMVGNAVANSSMLSGGNAYRAAPSNPFNVFAPPRAYQLMPTGNPNILYGVPIF